MAPKHQNEGGDAAPEAKKPKHGFRVGPENLPDGPWRRKVTKVKKELIHKAKVKKAYAKIKAREQQNAPAPKTSEPVQDEAPVEDTSEEKQPEEEGEEMHPTRQLMLADEAKAQENSVGEPTSDGNRRRTRRPGYYDKQLAKAAQRQEEAEMKRREFERRQEERAQKIAERQKFKKAMAKTRDRNGNKKLGRESSILLDKVRKLVAEK
ncbi:uncharacterized protein FTJAE_12776 [Fusarium tjaetaba]|uniref:rRNA-processing protein FYV7 n=1 Tax=Fusarium tjaetaba TaxID=1567544 RepID=A0A8H5QMN1_9HYPO|nr:uncharacterized protein FTJAE_12776 [Fusarium tjaetaba]KAF5617108.1 hypothetical protein FTJAE_12776 [Fusarium tjaetaba]